MLDVADFDGDIAAALAACPAGGVVWVPEGVFATDTELVVTKRVTVAGVGTVMGGAHPVFRVDADDVTFRGITVSRSTGAAWSDSTEQRNAVVVQGRRWRSIDCDYVDANLACIFLKNGLANDATIRGGRITNSSLRANSAGVYAASGPLTNEGIVVDGVEVAGTPPGVSTGIVLYNSSRCKVINCNVHDIAQIPTVTYGPAAWVPVAGAVYRARLASGVPGTTGTLDDRDDGGTNVVKRDGAYVNEDLVNLTNPGVGLYSLGGDGYLYLNSGSVDPNSQTVTSGRLSGYGVVVYATSTSTGVSGNLIAGNTIKDCAGFGYYWQLSIPESFGNTSIGNHLENVCTAGEQLPSLPFAGVGVLGGRGTSIIGDVIRNVGSATLGGPGVKVMNGGYTPLTCTGRMVGVTVEGSRKQAGVHLRCGGWTLTGCRSDGNYGSGYLVNYSGAGTIRNVVLAGCSAGGNGVRGVEASGSVSLPQVVQVSVVGGHFDGNAQQGIQLWDCSDSLVSGVSLRDNGSGSGGQLYLRGACSRSKVSAVSVGGGGSTVGVRVDAGCVDCSVVDVDSSTATPFNLGGVVRVGSRALSGAGAPEGVVAAPVGWTFSRVDGGTSTTFYVKESGSGNTGWVAK